MLMFKKGWLDDLMLIAAMFCGINAISIGSTFAQPSDFRPADKVIDRQADLIVALGVGLFVLCLVLIRLQRRIRTLEDGLRRDQ